MVQDYKLLPTQVARVQVKGHNDVTRVATLVVLLLPDQEESTWEWEVGSGDGAG